VYVLQEPMNADCCLLTVCACLLDVLLTRLCLAVPWCRAKQARALEAEIVSLGSQAQRAQELEAHVAQLREKAKVSWSADVWPACMPSM
jgi:hypothetical protein